MVHVPALAPQTVGPTGWWGGISKMLLSGPVWGLPIPFSTRLRTSPRHSCHRPALVPFRVPQRGLCTWSLHLPCRLSPSASPALLPAAQEPSSAIRWLQPDAAGDIPARTFLSRPVAVLGSGLRCHEGQALGVCPLAARAMSCRRVGQLQGCRVLAVGTSDTGRPVRSGAAPHAEPA